MPTTQFSKSHFGRQGNSAISNIPVAGILQLAAPTGGSSDRILNSPIYYSQVGTAGLRELARDAGRG